MLLAEMVYDHRCDWSVSVDGGADAAFSLRLLYGWSYP